MNIRIALPVALLAGLLGASIPFDDPVRAQGGPSSPLVIEGPTGAIEVIAEPIAVGSDGSVTAGVTIRTTSPIAYGLTFVEEGGASAGLEIGLLPLYPNPNPENPYNYNIATMTFPPGSRIIIRQDKWGDTTEDKRLMAFVHFATLVMYLNGAPMPTDAEAAKKAALVSAQKIMKSELAGMHLAAEKIESEGLDAALTDIALLWANNDFVQSEILHYLSTIGISVRKKSWATVISIVDILKQTPKVTTAVAYLVNASNRHFETTIRNSLLPSSKYVQPNQPEPKVLYTGPARYLQAGNLTVSPIPASVASNAFFDFAIVNKGGTISRLREIFVQGHTSRGELWKGWAQVQQIPPGETRHFRAWAEMWYEGTWRLEKVILYHEDGRFQDLDPNGNIQSQDLTVVRPPASQQSRPPSEPSLPASRSTLYAQPASPPNGASFPSGTDITLTWTGNGDEY